MNQKLSGEEIKYYLTSKLSRAKHQKDTTFTADARTMKACLDYIMFLENQNDKMFLEMNDAISDAAFLLEAS